MRYEAVSPVWMAVRNDAHLDHLLGDGPQHHLHHGEVLEVLMRLEQRVARDELQQDAPDGPDVAWERPPLRETKIHTHTKNSRRSAPPG